MKLIYEYRLLSRDAILDHTDFGSVTRLNARLTNLVRAGFLTRVKPFIASDGCQSMYTITTKAAPYLGSLGLDPEEVRQYCPRALHVSQIEHLYRIADLHKLLRTLEPSGVRCIYRPEHLCRHDYVVQDRGTKAVRSLRPDAFITFQKDERFTHFFVEVDCCQVSIPQFTKTVQSYLFYEGMGLCNDAYGIDRFGVLIVTSGKEGRLRNMLSAVPDSVRVPFWFVTFDELSASVSEAVWRCPKGSHRTLIQIVEEASRVDGK